MRTASVSPASLKRALLAGGITLVLAIPFVGVRLDSVDQRNGLTFHPLAVAAAVVAVVLGRLVFEGVASLRAVRQATRRAVALPRAGDGAAIVRPPRRWTTGRILARVAGLAAIAFALAFPFTPLATRYTLDLGATLLTYVMLGWGLNIVVGLAGLLDLGYVAFYAAGAYTFGILATDLGLGFWEALPLSGLVAGTLGVLLGFPVLRLKGDYLAIVTLGFGEIIRIIIINWFQLTGGPNGIIGIGRPSFFGVPFLAAPRNGGTTFAQLFGIPFSPLQRVAWIYIVILGLTLATLALTVRLRRLPIGRAWEALREDEIACRAVGLDPTAIKLTAFALGATIGGLAGCFFAAHQDFISPESFTFAESALILAVVVLGGGSQLGIAVAAAVLIGVPELGRSFEQYRLLVFGTVMVLVMVWRPAGFSSGRVPSVSADTAGLGEPSLGTVT